MTYDGIVAELISTGLSERQLQLVIQLTAYCGTGARKRAYDRKYQSERRRTNKTTRTMSYDSVGGYIEEEERREKPQKVSLSRATALTDDAQPSEKDRAYAKAQGWSEQKIDYEWDRFKNHAHAKGRTAKNWPAAWRSWVTSPLQNTRNGGNGGAPRPNSKEETSEIERSILRSWNPVPKADDCERSEDGSSEDEGILPFPKIGRSRNLPCRARDHAVRVSSVGGRKGIREG